jgi:hypothetical protein
VEVTNIPGDVRGTDWNSHALASAVACRHGDAARNDTTRVGGRVVRPDGIPACNNTDGEYGNWARKTGSSLADHTGDHQEHADFLASAHPRTLASAHPRTLASAHPRTLASAHPRTLSLTSRSTQSPAQLQNLPLAQTRPPPGTVGMAWRLVWQPGDLCDVGDSGGFVPVVVVGRVHWDGRIAGYASDARSPRPSDTRCCNSTRADAWAETSAGSLSADNADNRTAADRQAGILDQDTADHENDYGPLKRVLLRGQVSGRSLPLLSEALFQLTGRGRQERTEECQFMWKQPETTR